jgi:hypothetical protein
LPDVIGEQPWPMAFLQSLAAGLRKMAGELDPQGGGAAMSSIIEFPIADRPITENEIYKLHSEAFRDLEGEVCDLDRTGEIGNDLIMNCAAREDSCHNLELAAFAVWQLAKMLKEFRASYYAAWHGEKRGAA